MSRDLRSRFMRRGQERFTFQPSYQEALTPDVLRGLPIESGSVVVVTSNGGSRCSILDAFGNRQRVPTSSLVPFKDTRRGGAA